MSNGAIAIPAAFGWKDQDWVELLACMRLRKVIPVIGEELLQVEIEGETVPLYTWMAKRLASELDVPPRRAAVARVAQRRRVPVSCAQRFQA